LIALASQTFKSTYEILIKDIGRDEFLRLVDERKKALSYQSYEIDTTDFDVAIPATLLEVPKVTIDTAAFEAWKQSNVIVQKQAGYFRYQSAFRFLYGKQEL
jgi:sulfite reductase (ferredoxin)